MVHCKCSSLTAFLNSLRIVVERSSSGKEFHTLAPIKDVDFKPKVVVFLRGTTSLLAPLKFLHIISYNKQLACIFIQLQKSV